MPTRLMHGRLQPLHRFDSHPVEKQLPHSAPDHIGGPRFGLTPIERPFHTVDQSSSPTIFETDLEGGIKLDRSGMSLELAHQQSVDQEPTGKLVGQ